MRLLTRTPQNRSGRSTTSGNFLRNTLCTIVLAAAVIAPLASGVASAHAGDNNQPPTVPADLLDAAKQNDKGVFDVLVQGDGSDKTQKLADKLAELSGAKGDTRKSVSALFASELTTVSSVEIRLSGHDLTDLAKQKDKGIVSIVPNAVVTADKWGNSQKWPDAVDVKWYWGSPQAKNNTNLPTIAIVDSGVDNSNGQFGSRLLGQFDLGGGSPQGDPRGHGTFVAAMAAGAGTYSGTAPNAKLISLDIFDSQGRGKTSDVIHAVDWILQHKDEYNIRVANLSLQSGQQSSFLYDPLDQAVERLWQAGIVVTVAAGNYAVNGQASGVLYAPANDPFVITVGAADIHGSPDTKDDLNSPWSAYGYTNDGFLKPELSAPGRYLIEEVPGASTIFSDYPANVVKQNTIQLSGTSFAAPIVAGMAADLLSVHPDWTPDQIKGALMLTASFLKKAAPNSAGVGEVNLQKAMGLNSTPPNPNIALNGFLMPDPSGSGATVFNADAWIAAVQSNASWNSSSWNSASWNSASWSSASWNSASWNSASWNSASWNSASWNSASWNAVANNAAGDGQGDG
jgi:serine protease AprX